MAHLFISYSRADEKFVQQLIDELAKAGREIWIDTRSIPGGVPFLPEIYRAIEQADAFLFVVSSHSITSEYCNYELAHARKFNKRIIPLVLEQIKGELEKVVKGTWIDTKWEKIARDNYSDLTTINYLFFDTIKINPNSFMIGFQGLIEDLDTDMPHRQSHTEILTQASEWNSHARSPGYLLKGDQLVEAETWLKIALDEHKKPEPTSEQITFIDMSRKAENASQVQITQQRRRTRQFLFASSLLGVVLVLTLCVEFLVNQNVTTQLAFAAKTMTPIPLTVTAISVLNKHSEGIAFYAGGAYKKAQLLLSAAVANSTYVSDPQWYEDLANACFQNKDFSCTEQNAGQTIKLKPTLTTAYISLALAQREEGHFSNALNTLDQGETISKEQGTNDMEFPFTDYFYAHATGSIYFAQGSYRKTIDTLKNYDGTTNNQNIPMITIPHVAFAMPPYQKEIAYDLAASYEELGNIALIQGGDEAQASNDYSTACQYWKEYQIIPFSSPIPYKELDHDADAKDRMTRFKCSV